MGKCERITGATNLSSLNATSKERLAQFGLSLNNPVNLTLLTSTIGSPAARAARFPVKRRRATNATGAHAAPARPDVARRAASEWIPKSLPHAQVSR